MKKIERRAILCLLLTAMLVIGLGIFMYRYVTQSGYWVTRPYNTHLYTIILNKLVLRFHPQLDVVNEKQKKQLHLHGKRVISYLCSSIL